MSSMVNGKQNLSHDKEDCTNMNIAVLGKMNRGKEASAVEFAYNSSKYTYQDDI